MSIINLYIFLKGGVKDYDFEKELISNLIICDEKEITNAWYLSKALDPPYSGYTFFLSKSKGIRNIAYLKIFPAGDHMEIYSLPNESVMQNLYKTYIQATLLFAEYLQIVFKDRIEKISIRNI